METLIKVAINDFRLVFRDNSLKIFLALPLLTLVIVKYAVPYVVGIYESLQDYIPIILMMATTQGSTAFGFIYSTVLVDEKDTSVAKVYGILPISKVWFVVFRLIPPFVLATLTTFLLLLVEPFYGFPALQSLVYSMLVGLIVPLMIMFVAIPAKNKMEAMTWQKIFNLPIALPIAAFYVPVSFSFLFMIFPTFWAFQGLDSLINTGNFWLYMLIGFAQSILFIALLIQRFTRVHFK